MAHVEGLKLRGTGEVEPRPEQVGAGEEELHFLNGFHLLSWSLYPGMKITFNPLLPMRSYHGQAPSTYYAPVTLL